MKALLIILVACLPLGAQTDIRVEGRGLDIRPLKIGTPLYPVGTSSKFAAYRKSPHLTFHRIKNFRSKK